MTPAPTSAPEPEPADSAAARDDRLHVVVGSGPLGRSVARALLADGRRVRVVSRSGRGVEGAESRSVDISRESEYAEGAGVMYQCAQPAYQRWIPEFAALQRHVTEAAERTGARLVIADNLYAFGDAGGDVITDATPRVPRSRKGELRAAMAEEALALHAAGRVQLVLTQPSNYLGGGYGEFERAVLSPARRGRPMQFLGRLDMPHSFSYLPDAGRAMAAIGVGEVGWGRSWITPVLPAITQGELAARVWRAVGNAGQPKTTVISRGAARILGLAIRPLGELVEMWYEFDSPYRVDASEFERSFGLVASSWDDVLASFVGE